MTASEQAPKDVILCDVGNLQAPDMATVEALARLQLTVHRLGCEVRLLNAGAALRELLDLAGLSNVLPEAN